MIYIGVEDFVAGDILVNISQGSTRTCVNVGLLPDNILEGDEFFQLQLSGSPFPLFRSIATVTITDDGMFEIN